MKFCLLFLSLIVFNETLFSQSPDFTKAGERADNFKLAYIQHGRFLDSNCFEGITWIKIEVNKRLVTAVETNSSTPVAIDSFVHIAMAVFGKNVPKGLRGNSLILPLYYNFSGGCPTGSKTSPEYLLKMAEKRSFSFAVR